MRQPQFSSRRVSWIAVGAVMFCSTSAAAAGGNAVSRQGDWLVYQSQHFHVCVRAPHDPERIASHCESLIAALAERWLGGDVSWTSYCWVVVHSTEQEYLSSVGKGGRQTLGSAGVRISAGEVVARRIDLRGDAPESITEALAHELTHVVIADSFADRSLPRWADEGIAVLSDSQRKQASHQADLYRARGENSLLPFGALLAESHPLVTHSMATFYGQSASLVGFLVDRHGSAGFLDFVRHGVEFGYDEALRQYYGISSVAHLERTWTQHLREQASEAVGDLPRLAKL